MTAQLDADVVRDMSDEERATYDAQMESRVIRFHKVRPEWAPYREAALPAYQRALSPFIGTVGAENPAYRAQLPEGENFAFAIVFADPGRGAPLHAHTTEEVFMPLTGRWGVYWGVEGQHSLILEKWDAVSIPAPVMRGFWNASDHPAHILTIQGGGTQLFPIYAPSVEQEITDHGAGHQFAAAETAGGGSS
jgi:quercetin dioxygenase-like cupin family protein